MKPPLVGIIANPVSARDIRRIIASAGNMTIPDRANAVLRLLAGLAAGGVNRVVMMPERSGICAQLLRELERAARQGKTGFAKLDFLEMPVTGKAADSSLAAKMMHETGVLAIVVLGGDGTHRVVVRECGNIPIASVSTGTNNAFAKMHEPTITGLAVGLAVTAMVPPGVAFRCNKLLEVQVNGRRDIALVDVAIVNERFVGSRAIWRSDNFRELFVAFCEPGSIGMSSIAGLVTPVTREQPVGRHIFFSPPNKASFAVNVPLAPGLMEVVGIDRIENIHFDQPVIVKASTGSIALDGEREITFSEKERVSVVLRQAAFQTIDISACMTHAASKGLFVQGNISNLNIHT